MDLGHDISAFWGTHLVERCCRYLLGHQWPVGLYMNGELAQMQSGGLYLKSSILRSCHTCL